MNDPHAAVINTKRQNVEYATATNQTGPDADNAKRQAVDSGATRIKLQYAIELLEHDRRPSFVIDLAESILQRSRPLPIVYYNESVAQDDRLLHALLKDEAEASQQVEFLNFRSWLHQVAITNTSTVTLQRFSFSDIEWVVVPLHGFLIASGLPNKDPTGATELSRSPVEVKRNTSHGKVGDNELSEADFAKLADHVSRAVDRDGVRIFLEPDSNQDATAGDSGRIKANDTDQSLPDPSDGWSKQLSPAPHEQTFHDIDWASTSLGSVDTWSAELHQMRLLVMSDPEPAILFWGNELIAIHNEPAKQFFPYVQMMGSTVEKAQPELWKTFGVLWSTVSTTRQALKMENVPVLMSRRDRLYECFITYRFLPIEDNLGNLLGILELLRDVTKEVLSRRRLDTLLTVSTCSNGINDEKTFWNRLLDALGGNKQDVAFALLYSLEIIPGADMVPQKRPQHICHLKGLLGLPESHVSAKTPFDLENDSTGYAPGFRDALIKDEPILLDIKDNSLPEQYISGLKCRGYEGVCEAVVICPIRPTGGAKVVGFLVMGLSPHVAYDADFRQFIDILNRQIATSVASVSLFNEEIVRERKRVEEAALMHASLEDRLAQKTQALITSETKFERLTDKTPFGIVVINRLGEMTYSNKAYHEIAGFDGGDTSMAAWLAVTHSDDVPRAVASFEELSIHKGSITMEVRYKKEWVKEIDGAETVRTATWALVTAYAELDQDGEIANIIAAVTDISAQKWAEETHRRRMVEALEMKAQQESFIDMISHEIRNPLSAILQSADEVSDYLRQRSNLNEDVDTSLRNNIEAIETIMLCCRHQGRIVDDVLTLSKMNANMLDVHVEDHDPLETVQNVLKIFSSDAKKHGISLIQVAQPALQKMFISRLSFDPSRVSQVLVNLLGNAIKFTCDAPQREIRVIVGCFASKPASGDDGIQYIVDDEPVIASEDTSAGDEKVYLRIIVQDTGVGMSNQEKKKLFNRYAQASPRTHVKYGGSGLGLFISKKLCRLQGGAIGLKMGDSKGSTFAFFISTSRSKTVSATPVDPNSLAKLSIASEEGSTIRQILPSPVATVQPKNQHTLLVVEDNLINQKILCRQLRKAGYVVHSANDGREALEFLKQTTLWRGAEKASTDIPLSLILLDIEMPVMDGLTCIREVRRLEKEGTIGDHIPVIAVSANARRQQVEEAISAGMDDCVAKPFQIADLIPKIELLLNSVNTDEDR